jgi:hypothetical protein
MNPYIIQEINVKTKLWLEVNKNAFPLHRFVIQIWTKIIIHSFFLFLDIILTLSLLLTTVSVG